MPTLKELLLQKESINAEYQAVLKDAIDPINAVYGPKIDEIGRQIDAALGTRLAEVRALQAKEFGAVNITLDGVKVTETVSKVVTWDQEKLQPIFLMIQSASDNPFDFMSAKFAVPEKAYNAYPAAIKQVFEPARTVKPSPPKVEFKILDAEEVPSE